MTLVTGTQRRFGGCSLPPEEEYPPNKGSTRVSVSSIDDNRDEKEEWIPSCNRTTFNILIVIITNLLCNIKFHTDNVFGFYKIQEFYSCILIRLPFRCCYYIQNYLHGFLNLLK